MAEPATDGRLDQGPLQRLERLERASAFSEEVFARGTGAQFFSEFSPEDIGTLAGYMQVYRAQAGDIVIREGEAGDFMLLIIEGAMDILKNGARGDLRHVTSVGPGMTLGEMSMIDGEVRFATCVATTATVFAVMTREAMAKIMLDHPQLGTTILVRLVATLSERLRQASMRLLHFLDGGE